MIYSRFGATIEITRPVTTLEEVAALEHGRPTDGHDAERIKYGMYVAARFTDEDDGAERLMDIGMLRADGGIQEINKAVRALGGDPK